VDRLTDEQLMLRLQQGRPGALDELYRRYAQRLYAFCYNITRSKTLHEPEDLVQDVFVRLIKGAHTFNPEKASFRTWMFRIARNRCIDAIRREQIVRFIPLRKMVKQADGAEELEPEYALVDPNANVERSVIETSDMEAVRDCINELENTDEKQAIVLYYLGSKVYREIGEIIGKSTSMARNRVKSAQDKVRRCLERKGVNAAS
jgi:RNA polymerase sigma-70 factor (ECF subfamily)